MFLLLFVYFYCMFTYFVGFTDASYFTIPFAAVTELISPLWD